MVLLDDGVYVGHHADHPRDFVVEARDAHTGALRWEWPRLEASDQQHPPARADISWRLVGAAGVLYVPGPTTLTAVRTSDGEQLWQWPRGGLLALVASPPNRDAARLHRMRSDAAGCGRMRASNWNILLRRRPCMVLCADCV
jgi:hypothetical protein